MNNIIRVARKITFILFVEQSLASAGFIAAATLNSIVGANLSRHSGWAGVPTAVYLLAGASELNISNSFGRHQSGRVIIHQII